MTNISVEYYNSGWQDLTSCAKNFIAENQVTKFLLGCVRAFVTRLEKLEEEGKQQNA